jgi:Family of unknown function (DUF5519)
VYWGPLLQVALDRAGIADLGLVGVPAGVSERAALAQQVPTAVELDLQRLEALLIVLEALDVLGVRLFARAKLVLLGDQMLDAGRDAFVAHSRIVVAWSVGRRGVTSGEEPQAETSHERDSSIEPESVTIRVVPRSAALVDEVANELATWPGVRIERRADGAAVVRYERSELGVLHHDRGVVELPFLEPEHDELIERGEAEPDLVAPDSAGVSHDLHGPADVTEVLELFDRRYRDVRGEGDPYSSDDPA